MFDKHYQNQGFSWRCDKVNNVITVRLSDEEIDMLSKMFPDDTKSFAIRSLIHEGYKKRAPGMM